MTANIQDVEILEEEQKPGAYLALIRVQRGYSPEYVAGKLHLRVRLIELLEQDDYENMPESVFIKGYIRAYAKLLGIEVVPLLEAFHAQHTPERKVEKALWQSRRETNKAEHAVRWLTGFFAAVVLIAVAMWWYSNKDNEKVFSAHVSRTNTAANKSEADIRLTDLSKMRSLLSPQSLSDTAEKEGG